MLFFTANLSPKLWFTSATILPVHWLVQRHSSKAFSTRVTGKDFEIENAPCLGLCEHAPALMVRDVQRGDVDPLQSQDILEDVGQKPYGIIAGENRQITVNCGKRRATTLAEYINLVDTLH